MRHYVCECQVCHTQQQYAFEEPYPALGAIFSRPCNACCDVTPPTRVLTKRAPKELRAQQEESALRQVILDQCVALGFQARFLYQSVIITTPISSWQFDYHSKLKTLRHESSVKVNFATGDPAFTHEQFRDRKMNISEVIDYIATHDEWMARQ